MDSIAVSVLERTIVAGTPLLIGTVGEVICERSGILNLGVEGMMSVGAVSAFIVTYSTGNPWLGMGAAIIAGMLISLIHAFVSVTLQASQVVSGLALTMLGLGMSGIMGKSFVGTPLSSRMDSYAVPYLSDIPVLGQILFKQSPFFYLGVILAVVSWLILEYTRWGIIVRSTGENPKAADAQGINVSFVRYLCIMIGGGFAGMAGANLSISYSKSWIEGMTAGRGWIVIALTIFALWNPMRAIIGAFLFGGIFVLQYLLQPLGISPSFLAMLPYIATLGVLLMGSIKNKRRLAGPEKLGEPYVRGER